MHACTTATILRSGATPLLTYHGKMSCQEQRLWGIRQSVSHAQRHTNGPIQQNTLPWPYSATRPSEGCGPPHCKPAVAHPLPYSPTTAVKEICTVHVGEGGNTTNPHHPSPTHSSHTSPPPLAVICTSVPVEAEALIIKKGSSVLPTHGTSTAQSKFPPPLRSRPGSS